MSERGVQQWHPGELSVSWFEEAIRRGSVRVARSGDALVGSMVLTWEDPFIWGEMQDRAGYIHNLMIDRAFGGHGVGRALLAWAEGEILVHDRLLARLDSVRSNARLRSYYEGCGYRLVGHKQFPEIEWAFETSLYEKQLR